MQESLTDIESLALNCHSEQSKIYISEAIRCYRAGAFRAAIVTTWVAVVFDLIDKIRELALSGDAAAITVDSDYQKYNQEIQNENPQGIKDGLQFERDLLKTCKERLQFFDVQQFMELERLQDDRHRCAHPTFQEQSMPYMPSAELARLHLRNAIIYVLSQPPVQGRAALAKLENLLQSDYFPKEVKNVISQFESNGLKRATPSLINSFVDNLVLDFTNPNRPVNTLWKSVLSLEALHELHTGIVQDRLQKQLNKLIQITPDSEFHLSVYLAGVCRRFAGAVLNTASIHKLEMFIQNSNVAWAIAELRHETALKNKVVLRINTFDVNLISQLVYSPDNLHDLLIPRAISLLQIAPDTQQIGDIVARVMIPLIPSLTVENIKSIFTYPYGTKDIKISYGFYNLALNIARSGLLSYEHLNQLLQANGFLPVAPFVQSPETPSTS